VPELRSDFVEVVVFRRDKTSVSFLLLKRAATEMPYPGIWQVVSGRRKLNESATDTAVREVREETGIDPLGVWVLPFVNTFYAPDGDAIHSVPTFAAETPPTETVRLSDEHSECSWVSRKEAAEIVHWPSHLTMMDLVTGHVLSERSAYQKIYPNDHRKATS